MREQILKQNILKTSGKLFQKYGFNKTTMEDIAKSMAKGKSSIYYYFKCKDDIFLAVITQEVEQSLQMIKDAIENESSSVSKLQILFKTYFEIIRSKVLLYDVLKEENIDKELFIQNKLILKITSQYKQKERDIVKQILLTGIENQEFKAEILDNIDLIAYIIVTTIRSITIDFILNNETHSFIDLDKANIVTDILLKGIKK